MWRSVAHAAAPHRSKPGEERRHPLPGRQERFSHHQVLSSTARRSMDGALGMEAGHFPRPASRAGHCGPLALRVGWCALLAHRVAPCGLQVPRVASSVRRGVRAAPCQACRAGDLIPTLLRQGGMIRRCHLGRAAAPACHCPRAPARFHRCHPMMSACQQTIRAARLRSGLKGDRRRAQPRCQRRQEDGMMRR